MTGIGAAAGDLVQLRELAGFFIERVRGYGAAAFAFEGGEFVDGVEIFFVGGDGEEGRVLGLRGDADGSELAGFGVEAERVDAFAVGFVGVGADEGEELRGVFAGGGSGGK